MILLLLVMLSTDMNWIKGNHPTINNFGNVFRLLLVTIPAMEVCMFDNKQFVDCGIDPSDAVPHD